MSDLETIAQLRKALEWAAQTVHQGHHHEQPYTWRECPRGFCASIRHELGVEKEELVDGR